MSADNLDVSQWVRFAQMDYDYALKSSETFCPVPIEIICYHCQQSAEKILKAYAIAKNQTLIKTHDLIVLLKQCGQYLSDFNNYANACVALTSYATISRYPSNTKITEAQMKQALKNAENILEFTKTQLVKLGYAVN